MVVHGRESTVPVTMDEILFMTQWVVRGAKRPIVIADMPFGSYEASDEEAVRNAVRLVKEGGADVVKLEGGGTSVSRARAIVDAGIGVMGHVGLTPQSSTTWPLTAHMLTQIGRVRNVESAGHGSHYEVACFEDRR